MAWLNYSDDEVKRFHVEFELLANKCLIESRRDKQFHWVHHDPTSLGGIPDFVLYETSTNLWVLVVEIKKTRAAITSSSQYRRQAHSYPLENQSRFRPGKPFFYCLTNIEDTALFGANDVNDLSVPPNSRVVRVHEHGRFGSTLEADHKTRFVEHFGSILEYAASATSPLEFKLNFPNFWNHAEEIARAIGPHLAYPILDPYSQWFSTLSDDTAKGFLLTMKILLSEWIVHQSELHGHASVAQLRHVKNKSSDSANRDMVADVIERCLRIDYKGILGDEKIHESIRALSNREVLNRITAMVQLVEQLQLDQLVELLSSDGLSDLLFEQIQRNVSVRAKRGTVQTDVELANVVAELAMVDQPSGCIALDPCCGIGNLLSALYVARSDSIPHEKNARNLVGIEIDPIQASLAGLQVVMKAPAIANANDEPKIITGSLTRHKETIAKADAVVMNPPFKRYENDGDPLPEGYRFDFKNAIEDAKGEAASTLGGQSDLYNYYVEFVVSSMKQGARGVFILNNKWMNTKTTRSLREFLCRYCEIEGVLLYPQGAFFREHMIATSILVFKKVGERNANHQVRFCSCKKDLRSVSAVELSNALFAGAESGDVSCASVLQDDVASHTRADKLGSWRSFWGEPESLCQLRNCPRLVDLFEDVVRGRLETDEVSKVLSFPFRDWTNKGTAAAGEESKQFVAGGDREKPKGCTIKESVLREISEVVRRIPSEFRGYAIKTSDSIGAKYNYVLNSSNFSHAYESGNCDAIIEPPMLKVDAYNRGRNKVPWSNLFDLALGEMRAEPSLRRFMELVEEDLGLKHRPKEIVWEDLRRPCAGEILLLRNFRVGWRAHLNPLAFNTSGPQLRVSSNLWSLRDLKLSSVRSDRETMVTTILAFLMSSFGQIQFEFYGDNREGTRKIEKATCVDKVRCPNPELISSAIRDSMIKCLKHLPCPIESSRHPAYNTHRRKLDILVAQLLLGNDTDLSEAIRLADQVEADLDQIQNERME